MRPYGTLWESCWSLPASELAGYYQRSLREQAQYGILFGIIRCNLAKI
jgi:hypothetical protein